MKRKCRICKATFTAKGFDANQCKACKKLKLYDRERAKQPVLKEILEKRQALDDAAKEYANKISQIGHSVWDYHNRAFKAGALSLEAMRYWEMNSPQVKALRDALESIDKKSPHIVDPFEAADMACEFKILAVEALKAWDEREK